MHILKIYIWVSVDASSTPALVNQGMTQGRGVCPVPPCAITVREAGGLEVPCVGWAGSCLSPGQVPLSWALRAGWVRLSLRAAPRVLLRINRADSQLSFASKIRSRD